MSETAASVETAAPADAASSIVDAGGTAFRPGFHRTNPDGSPFRNRRGRFMPKGGRKARQHTNAPVAPATAPEAASVPVSPEPAAPAPTPVTAAPKADFSDFDRIAAGTPEPAAPGAPAATVTTVTHEAAMEATLRGAYATLDAVTRGRGEWQPEDASEHGGLKDSWVACQQAYGWAPLPPILAAIGSSLAYVWKRLSRPNTAKLICRFFPSLGPVLGIEPKKVEPTEPPKTVAASAAQPPAKPQPTPAPGVLSTSSRQADASDFFR